MSNRERIEKLFCWTPDYYAILVEDAGYAWADRFFDREGTDLLVQCAMFWRWWTNEWNIRDEEFLRETSLRFLNEKLTGLALQTALEEYVDKHQVCKLNIAPNRLVREELELKIREAQKEIDEMVRKKDEEIRKAEAQVRELEANRMQNQSNN